MSACRGFCSAISRSAIRPAGQTIRSRKPLRWSWRCGFSKRPPDRARRCSLPCVGATIPIGSSTIRILPACHPRRSRAAAPSLIAARKSPNRSATSRAAGRNRGIEYLEFVTDLQLIGFQPSVEGPHDPVASFCFFHRAELIEVLDRSVGHALVGAANLASAQSKAERHQEGCDKAPGM